MVSQLLIFLIFLFFFVYFPGHVLYRLFLESEETDVIIKLSLYLTVGLTLLILVSALLQLAGLPKNSVFSFPVIVFLLWFLRTRGRKPLIGKLSQPKKTLFVLFFIIICSLIQAFPLVFAGQMNADGSLSFTSIHDNLWNIAIINNLIDKFPPDNPAISGFILKNHHYFYHYFLALAARVTAISVFDLYFRLGPFLVAFLFGLSLYAVAALFTKNVFFRTLSVFLGYFSGNFAYLAPIFFKNISDWRGNLFFADQPFDQIFNPYTVAGFAVFLMFIFCLARLFKNKKPSLFWYLAAAILAGTSFGIKSFGGLLVILSILSFTIISFAVYRNRKVLFLFLLSLIVFFPIYLLIASPGKVSLNFIPGWLLREMMVGQDKLNQPVFADLENYYQTGKNIPGLLKIKFIELSIYLVGNLGVRLLGFIYFLKLFKSPRPKHLNQKRSALIFILLATLASLSIPLLFNLSASPFNIVQFTPYALVLLSIATALFLEDLTNYLNRKNLKTTAIAAILIIVVLSLPVNVKNFLSKLSRPHDLISQKETEALFWLSDNSKQDSLILINPDSYSVSPIYIPALSRRPVYLADPGYAIQTGIDPNNRQTSLIRFFQQGAINRSFLTQNKINYLYLLKSDISEVDRQRLLSDNIYQEAFENDRVLILKTNL